MKKILLVVCTVGAISVTNATIVSVGQDGLSDFTTITDALMNVEAGDIIEVSAGIYSENLILPTGIELRGEILGEVPADTIIDGGDHGPVLTMTGCDSSTLIYGFTIRNGSGTVYIQDPNPPVIIGGGLLLNNSSPTIENCIITDNTADIGGGIACVENSNPYIKNCRFNNNSANTYGGGLACHTSSPQLDDSVFYNNRSLNDAGGIFADFNCQPILRRCSIELNNADDDGGGVYSLENTSFIVEDCIFRGNTAGDKAGAFYCDTYDMSILKRCLFIDNEAKYYGGAIYVFANCSPKVYDSRFLGNTANNSGGAVRNYSSCIFTAVNCVFHDNLDWGWGGAVECRKSCHADLINCTFIHNFAMVGGGLSLREQSSANIDNCIFWDNNTSGNGDQLSAADSEINVNHCVVDGGWEDIYNEDGIAIINYDALSNITEDPKVIDGDGPDDTFGTEDDNPRLRKDSPCIDRGNRLVIPEEILSDIDGYLRIVDGNCDGILEVDIGAHELNHAVQGDLDGDCNSSLSDFKHLARSWLSSPNDAAWNPMCDVTNAPVSIIDIADLILISENWLWQGTHEQ